MVKVIVILLAFSLPYLQASPADDIGLNAVEIIENHGYTCESHSIITEDGYILTYHRIPRSRNGGDSGSKPAVLLMHGMGASSADYINVGTNRSLGFLLADAGYDVWLGNSRGTAWSRNHTTLDVASDPEEFFDFSWHEMGYYDLPAAIDYILEVNGGDSLHYVGHSQGCTDFLVLASTRPEYNAKIKVASLLAPASFMENTRELDFFTVAGKYIYEIEHLFKKYKIYEIPYLEVIRPIVVDMCQNPDFYGLCNALLSLFGGGADDEQIIQELIPVIVTNAPANMAIKQLIHYGQQIKNGGFSLFDYGAEKDLELYGTETPPAYDLSKITAPVAVYYGLNDGLVPAKDAQNLISKLPNVANDYLVPYDLFNHIDFIFARDVVELLYNEVIAVMAKY